MGFLPLFPLFSGPFFGFAHGAVTRRPHTPPLFFFSFSGSLLGLSPLRSTLAPTSPQVGVLETLADLRGCVFSICRFFFTPSLPSLSLPCLPIFDFCVGFLRTPRVKLLRLQRGRNSRDFFAPPRSLFFFPLVHFCSVLWYEGDCLFVLKRPFSFFCISLFPSYPPPPRLFFAGNASVPQ